MNRSEKIRLIYGICLSVLTAAVGIAFIAEVADLYYGALSQGITPIYTVERISERLVLPLVLLFVWIAAAIAGYVLSVVFPVAKARKSAVDNDKVLDRLKDRLPEAGGEGFDEAKKELKKKEKIRICVWAVAYAVIAGCAIAIAVYVFNPSHYNGAQFWRSDILALVKNIIIWVAIGLAAGIGAVIYNAVSVKREIALAKKALAVGDKKATFVREQKGNRIIAASVATGASSLLLIVLFVLAPSVMTAVVSPIVSGKTDVMPTVKLITFAILFIVLAAAGLFTAVAVRKYVPEKANKIILLCSRVAVGVVAVTFIIVGALNGGAQDVLVKAINICTECIGLG